MRTVFVDTWFFLALVNAADQGHPRVVTFTQSYAGNMLTTGWVLTEFADALASTPRGRAEFVSTLDDFQASPDAAIVPCDDTLLKAGIRLYAQRPDKKWPLTDCISFVVMQRENLTEALTADHHFEQAGFVALLN